MGRAKWLISKLVSPLLVRFVILLLVTSVLILSGAEASSVSPSSRQGLPKEFKVERLTYQGSLPLYRPGEILVKFKTTTPTAERERVKALAGLVSTLREIGPKDRKDLHLIKLKPDVSVEEAIKKLKSQSEVLYAEPNYIVKALYTPNDPSFSNQWGLNNTGQTIKGVAGTPDADIDAPEAWDIEKGQSNPVTVAVLDSGIDFAHPELSSKIWQNSGEIAGNGIDDDSNGYTDDVNGYNWAGISQTQYFYYDSGLGTYVPTYWALGSNAARQILAQSIKGTGQKLTHVGILLSKSGSPTENITVSLRTSLSGQDIASFTISPSEVGTTETEIYKPLSFPVTLSSGTTYYIVMRTANNSSTNYYKLYDNWGSYSYDIYRDGQEHQWDGFQWVDWLTDDFYFRTNPNSYPRDDDGHGTHVSGIIGAASDNSQGITGLSFGAKILPLKVLNSSGVATISDGIAAIYYAADNGARVTNMSLASSVYSQSVQDAVNYTYGKGVVLVAAAGNSGDPTISYPAGNNHVIGVGATTNQDQKAYFSNYNSSVDVNAPGVDIYSTLPTYPVALNSLGYAQNYDYVSGTSMATPMVAGLAALVLSKNPAYTPLQVEQYIENNADDLGAAGWDSSFGYGRINAYRTLASFTTPPPPPPPSGGTSYYFTWYDYVSGGMNGNWILVGNPSTNTQTANVDIYIGTTKMGSYSITPGGRVTPTYANIMNGPVRIVSTNSVPVFSSQRVLYLDSFNEVMSVPDSSLDTEYYFTWYDYASGGMNGNWILVGNPSTTQTANVDIYIGSSKMGTYSIAPGGKATPSYPNTMNGPVRVVSTNGVPIFTSQRVLYKNSFSEVMGIPKKDLSTEYYFTWYDYASPGMNGNWILVGNPSTTQTANVDIYIGGTKMGSYTIAPGGRVTPSYPNTIGGPVRVISTNGVSIFTSQRVLYLDSFEEVTGIPSPKLKTDYWFTWYDSMTSSGMNGNWVLVGNPSTNSQTANVDIYIGGTKMGSYPIAPGGRITPSYPNVMNGPVRVVSTNGVSIFTSQRVLYKNSFNEVVGFSF